MLVFVKWLFAPSDWMHVKVNRSLLVIIAFVSFLLVTIVVYNKQWHGGLGTKYIVKASVASTVLLHCCKGTRLYLASPVHALVQLSLTELKHCRRYVNLGNVAQNS